MAYSAEVASATKAGEAREGKLRIPEGKYNLDATAGSCGAGFTNFWLSAKIIKAEMETTPDSGPEGIKKIDWRQFGKHWIVVFILAILAAFVIWGMLKAGPWLRQFQDWRAARTLQNELEKLYRNDKYGGKTPEETFDMFIAALEKGDVELASKYFVLEKQESWKQSLATLKEQPAIYNEMLAEMKFARANSRKDVGTNSVWFSYTMPGERLGEQLVFERIFNRWKISVL